MLEIITAELPKGYIGENYYVKLKTNCSECLELLWKIESGGALPPKLILEKNGVIFGIPERAERADLYFTVTNQKTRESTGKNLKIVIASIEPTELKIITNSVPEVIVGVPYSFTFKCSGGVPPYTWSADDLPDGLNFENGTISGTAKFSGGNSPFNVKLCDSKNNTVVHFYLINMRCQ